VTARYAHPASGRIDCMRLLPAEVVFDARGTPFSAVYGDVYHSADSGPGQSRHVFLEGNGLPSRWARTRVFTIVETGFGFGLNFLTTWKAWRDDPARPEHLHFVSLEKHPFTGDGLARLHALYPELGRQSEALRSRWPQLVPGMHRLDFDAGGVTLTLAFGDAMELLPRLRLAADAFYLDGFAPDRNPEMWSPKVFKSLARIALPGATLATYTAARAVREGLDAAGFAMEKRPGFGCKRDMLAGRYAPRWKMRHRQASRPAWPERHALVVGASLAGAAVCERLADRGWEVDLIERRPEQSNDTAALLVGAFHPHVSADDCILSRLTRNAFLLAICRWLALEQAGLSPSWERCGVLQSAANAEQEARMARMLESLAYPASFASYVPKEEASRCAGYELAQGGWWYPQGGWIRPTTLIAAQIGAALTSVKSAARVRTHFGRSVASLRRVGNVWQAIADDGTLIAEAPVAVLANSSEAAKLASVGPPMRRLRGQVSFLPPEILPQLRTVVTGKGHVSPAVNGMSIVGSTYDRDDDDCLPNAQGHKENLVRLARLIPSRLAGCDPETLQGAVGFRCVSPDRLPLIGELPDLDEAHDSQVQLSGAHLPDLPRRPGLFGVFALGSRGLIWAALGSEVVASLIEGEPMPLESDLADAVDPGRFTLRLVRHQAL
jgi:tRNA 5-methylaminomethyl-2-thiouridine biosynthesis bifunctional protein